MAMMFRGPIPDWLNPETAGYRYRDPPDVPVHVAGRDLLDDASAAYALAPERERHNLRVAAEEMRKLNVPLDPDRKQTLQYVEWLYRADQTVVLMRTPEFKAWLSWKISLDEAVMQFNRRLMQGEVRAFGELGQPHSCPHWIDRGLWGHQGLKADPGMTGKFAGHGLVYWNVRAVDASEVIATHEAREARLEEVQVIAARVHPSWDDCERWFVAYVHDHASDPRHPTEERDLEAAAKEFKFSVYRKWIRDLRDKHVPADRRRQGPSKS